MSLAGNLLSAKLNLIGDKRATPTEKRRPSGRQEEEKEEEEAKSLKLRASDELRRCELVCSRLGPQLPVPATGGNAKNEQQQPRQSYRSAAAKGSSSSKQATQIRSLAKSMTMTSKKSAGSAPSSRQRQAGAKQLLLWLAAAILLVGHSLADYSPAQQQPQQQQQLEANNYGGQQANGAAAKAKKIQIVYIKVPLNKLKPSLSQGDQYAGSASAPVADNATTSYGPGGDSTKSHGSQPEQTQQPGEASRQQQQPSFLIPMAVVQSDGDSPSSAGPIEQQQQPLNELDEVQVGRQVPKRLSRRPQQSPMQLYQQLLVASSMGSNSVPLHQGFMSSFLLAEKERLTSAALRLASSQQQQSLALPAPQQLQPAATTTSTTNTNPQQITNDANVKPGGLMPVMMMPFSHMPDNMIGQAYNAAVGQALPLELGSAPASSIIGKQTAGSGAGYQQQQQATAAAPLATTLSGGAPGTSGPSGVSPLTGSGVSYGASGPNPSEANSSANGYRNSASGSGAYGPLSGFGSGTNSFGASVAFSDYPNAPSSGYSSSSSSNSNSYSMAHQHQYQSSPQSSSSGGPLANSDDYAGQRLRQAKKTIIPIVVQVEHAIMESNQQLNKGVANRYVAGLRNQGKRGSRQQRGQRQPGAGFNQQQNNLYGSSSQESPVELGQPGQYINAANAQDINQITAQINAENAASAAAALAQADMAFGPGGPAYIPQQQQQRPAHFGQHNQRPQSTYAAGLQSAASALLANTHPVLQAAASGGLASVSKLGAKLGEMMALPSMQVPHPIAALPSALSSITNQMGLQLNQAVQQVAKEHPSAHAFARQVAQHAGLQLPNFVGHPQPASANPQNPQHQGMMTSASQPQQQQQSILASPQAQLQNLKLSIGQNLQSAAAQLIGAHQKGQTQQAAAAMLANPLSALYPPVVNSALKTLAGSGPIAAAAASGLQTSASAQQPQVVNFPGADISQQQQSQQQFSTNQQQQLAGPQQSDQQQVGLADQQQVKQAGSGKPTLKSKFLSFFQPPKFISSLLSWNDRADDRLDQVSESARSEPAAESDAKIADKTLREASAGNATSGSSEQLQAKVAPIQVTDSSQVKTEEQEAANKVIKVDPIVNNSTSATSGRQ